MKIGIAASHDDAENGMTLRDMRACLMAANELNEIIMFRSTGPWSKRWLEANPPFPSKNFHVKGKSSDWGPMAGFVPYDGEYCKVGHDETEARKSTRYNEFGLESGFASKSVLRLTLAQLQLQRHLACEVPRRTALDELVQVPDREDYVLACTRPRDQKIYRFLAHRNGDAYDILILKEDDLKDMLGSARAATNLFLLLDAIRSGKVDVARLPPLEVMVSEEVGADRRPMTGDYDLMAVCPPWRTYMDRSMRSENKEIRKPAIRLNGGTLSAGQAFGKKSFLDKVLDTRLTTGAPTPEVDRRANYDEHGDMGNLTPRILNVINILNAKMGAIGDRAALRRVHHNAESHRNLAFGALEAQAMWLEQDGFPLTAFHPAQALRGDSPLARYGDVITLEYMAEFKRYCADVHKGGYYVPKNWTWGLSIRDTADETHANVAALFPRRQQRLL
jgi:hypothetical protein